MKILVVTLSNLGDVVLTLPVVQALQAEYPHAKMDVIGGVAAEQVFHGDPSIRRYTLYDKKMSWSARWAFLKTVRSERYDILVDLRYSLIGLLGGAKKRNSYLTPRPKRRRSYHEAALRGLAEPFKGASYLLRFEKSAIPEGGGPWVVACPGSKSDIKKWPAEKYAELLDRLAQERGCSVALVGDKQDDREADKIRRLMTSPVTDFCGRTDFKTLVGILRRASLDVTNDSAPLHIADSLGIPTVALFGPSDPEKYGPSGPSSAAVSKNLFCQPCEKAQCRYAHECMKDLGVPAVYEKASRLLSGQGRTYNFKLLVLRLDRLGDVVLSLPAIAALRRRYPQAFISVMTRPYTQGVLEGHPLIDEVIAYDYAKSGKHASANGYWRLLREIRKRRFDAAVILHPGLRPTLIPFLTGIPYRVGYKNKHSFLLTRAVKDMRSIGKKHESQYALDLVKELGAHWFDTAAVPLYVDGSALRKVRTMVGASRLEKQRPLIVLHPGASCVSKRWPAESFERLAAEIITKRGANVIVVGDAGEKETGDRIVGTRIERALNLAGRLELRELAALLSEADLLVSNDSGPVHVAAAVGTHVISIFGRNQSGLSPKRWKPLGSGHAVVQKDVGCAVCLAHRCPIGFECLQAITVEDILARIDV